MEYRRYLAILRRFAPFIIACALLGAGVALVASLFLPKSYEATATLVVGQSLTTANPQPDQLATSVRLSQTYASVATMVPTLQAVIDSLDLTLTPEELRLRVKASAAADTTLLSVRAIDADPVMAAAIANAVASELIDASQDVQGRQALDKRFVDEELTSLQAYIQQLNDEVRGLESLVSRTPDEQRAKAMQLEVLQASLQSARATFSAMLPFASTSVANLLTPVDPAIPPDSPASPRILLNTLLGALIGLFLAVGVVFLRESQSDTLRSAQEVEDVAGLPTLGVITRSRGRWRRGMEATLAGSRSPVSEAFREVRTNLGVVSEMRPFRVVQVTSAVPGEGKTSVACNLAVVFAQAGKRVILLDGDLRRPGVHRAFDTPNTVGLSTLLRGEDLGITAAAVQVQPGLRIVTGGPVPPDPAELLASQRMKAVLQDLAGEADIVIVDSPSLRSATDAAVIATLADGTLLVIDAGKTRRATVRQARETLDRVQARVLGVILNNFPEGVGQEYLGFVTSRDSAPETTGGRPGGPAASDPVTPVRGEMSPDV